MSRRCRLHRLTLLGLIPLLVASAPASPPSRIFIASDSTAQDYAPAKYPQSGWGTMLRCAFGPEVTVDNRAIGGRSTKSFMKEGRLDQIARELRRDDTLLVQFGHNDANRDKPERYTPIPEYETRLKQFIAVARAAQATPVLLTPVTQRRFSNGVATHSFPDYADAVRRVAGETHTPMIDLAALSEAWISKVGEQGSARFYLHYTGTTGAPGFPNGIDDDTHFSELGARRVADLVASGLARLRLPISHHVLGVRPALSRDEPAGDATCA